MVRDQRRGDQETAQAPRSLSLSRRCSLLLSIELPFGPTHRGPSHQKTPLSVLFNPHRDQAPCPPSVPSVINPRSVHCLYLPELRATSSSSTYTHNAHDPQCCPRAATAGHARDTIGPGAPRGTATRPRQTRSATNRILGFLRPSSRYSRATARERRAHAGESREWQRRCFVSASPPLVPVQRPS